MRTTTLADQDLAIIYKRATEGESIKTLAREFKRDSSALYRLLNRRYGYRAGNYRRAVWEPTYVAPTTVADLAYIAGIIDGEGSIMKRPDGIWIVRVNMTDQPIIKWLHSFGGTFRNRPSKDESHKDQFEWMVARQADVEVFLKAILPHMRVKRARAQEALAYLGSH